MSVIDRLSSRLNRRDEQPNIELARDLVARRDADGIAEIARNLWNEAESVRSDCIKVLYEIGALQPALIAGFIDDFLRLLQAKNNRLVWGAMTALAEVAPLRADTLCLHLDEITRVMETGSVITRDQAVRVLAALACSGENCAEVAFSRLMGLLAGCRSKDVPQYAESIFSAGRPMNPPEFMHVLEKRLPGLSNSQRKRVEKVIRQIKVRHLGNEGAV
jgi:hypothetical protein